MTLPLAQAAHCRRSPDGVRARGRRTGFRHLPQRAARLLAQLSRPAASRRRAARRATTARVFVSRDGNARLLAGALPNDRRHEPARLPRVRAEAELSGRRHRLRTGARHLVRAVGHPRRHHVLRARDLHLRRAAHQQLGHALSGGRAPASTTVSSSRWRAPTARARQAADDAFPEADAREITSWWQ